MRSPRQIRASAPSAALASASVRPWTSETTWTRMGPTLAAAQPGGSVEDEPGDREQHEDGQAQGDADADADLDLGGAADVGDVADQREARRRLGQPVEEAVAAGGALVGGVRVDGLAPDAGPRRLAQREPCRVLPRRSGRWRDRAGRPGRRRG